jgi:hypothetical protein
MARRLVFKTPAAKVYWDPEWREYVVRHPGNPDADYFTSDKDDAIQTASRATVHDVFMRRAPLGDPPETHTRHASAAAERFTLYAQDAYNKINDGRCDLAVHALTRAAAAIGHLVAHSGAGAQGIPTNMYASSYDYLRDDVIGACVIKRRKRSR